MALFPDIVVMIPRGTSAEEIRNRVAAAIRDSEKDTLTVDTCVANFERTVEGHHDPKVVAALATHYIRVFEEV